MEVFKIGIWKINFFTLSIIVALTLVSCSQSPNTPDESERRNGTVTHAINRQKSEAFLTFVSEISLEDIRLAQLVEQRSASVDVKHLGTKIEAGHMMVLKHIKVFSEKKGIRVPKKMTVQNEYQALSALNGTEFDAEFCGYMVKEHENVADKFRETSVDRTIDADIRIWAESMIPVFESNQEAAHACLASISGT